MELLAHFCGVYALVRWRQYMRKTEIVTVKLARDVVEHVIVMGDGKSIYDITEVVPELLGIWKKWNEEEAIYELMKDSGCHVYAKGKNYAEATGKLLRQVEGVETL